MCLVNCKTEQTCVPQNNKKFLACAFQFLQQDIPLFEGIISDLFPGVELPRPDYGALETEILKHTRQLKLQPVPWFIEKIIQVPQTAFAAKQFRITSHIRGPAIVWYLSLVIVHSTHGVCAAV